MALLLLLIFLLNNCKLILRSFFIVKVDKENNVIKTCNDDVKSCTMLDIFKNLINDFEVPVGKAIMMLSENPAR